MVVIAINMGYHTASSDEGQHHTRKKANRVKT